jgi:hypothetical protein
MMDRKEKHVLFWEIPVGWESEQRGWRRVNVVGIFYICV